MDSIYGELPTGPVVYAACDSRYFLEHALPFALSASKARHDIHIHITNPEPDVLSLAGIINATANTRVTYTFDEEDLEKFNQEEARTYFACLRFHVLPHIIRSANKVMTLDVDCMLMQPIDFADMPACGYFPRAHEQDPGMKVAAGAVYLSAESIKIAEAISKFLSAAPLQWYVDQFVLSEVFRQVPQSNIKKFDNDFMDWEFRDGTTIWTGKGARKFDNPIYLEKKDQLLQETREKLVSANKILLKPRLDIPFKKIGLSKRNYAPLPAIRQHWENFSKKTDADLIIELPRWMFNSTIEEFFLPDSIILVPHMERKQWGSEKNHNTYFYMQTVFPWLFTIDSKGWGGGAAFVNKFDPDCPFNDDAFNKLRQYALSGKSKFAQPLKGDNLDLTSPTIFVPLQIPHDETIKHHSNITVPEFVGALCEWAEEAESRPHILFKGHPVNRESMAPLQEIISGYRNSTYRENLNIHSVMPKVDAIYVINSGTGQEAMLHEKPVVTFGYSEYVHAVIKGDIANLDQAWSDVLSSDKVARSILYRRWFHWYLNEVTFDTSA